MAQSRLQIKTINEWNDYTLDGVIYRQLYLNGFIYR